VRGLITVSHSLYVSLLVLRGTAKTFPEFSDVNGLAHLLDGVLLVTSTCKFCRGSGATSGRQWILHHNNTPSHTSLVVSSPNHRTLRTSLQWLLAVPHSENGPQGGHVSQQWTILNRKRRPNSGRFQQKFSAGTSNSGRNNRASVWAQGSYC
jgi:hypothetical protein